MLLLPFFSVAISVVQSSGVSGTVHLWCQRGIFYWQVTLPLLPQGKPTVPGRVQLLSPQKVVSAKNHPSTCSSNCVPRGLPTNQAKTNPPGSHILCTSLTHPDLYPLAPFPFLRCLTLSEHLRGLPPYCYTVPQPSSQSFPSWARGG